MFDQIPEDPDTIPPAITMVQIRCGHCGERFVMRESQRMMDLVGDAEDRQFWAARCPFCIATNAVDIRIEGRFIETRVARKKRLGTPIKDAIEESVDRLRKRTTTSS